MKCEYCKDPIYKFQKFITIPDGQGREIQLHEGCYEIVIDLLRKHATKSNKSLKPTSKNSGGSV